jgi:tripeptidyl-peptidase I
MHARATYFGSLPSIIFLTAYITYHHDCLHIGAPNISGKASVCQCNINSASTSMPYTWSGPAWTGSGYFPSFPASCPWVTAVGATMGPQAGTAEVGCQSNAGGVITSGGGFSTYYPTASWQTNAVKQYFSSLPASEVPTAGYNPFGRGYPDVSLIGVYYEVVIANTIQLLFGTSCSSPVFAAMVSLINSDRANKSLSSIGFLNPTLYSVNTTSASAGVYNDITSGSNFCCAAQPSATCCKSGFYTAPGWDPMTGNAA